MWGKIIRDYSKLIFWANFDSTHQVEQRNNNNKVFLLAEIKDIKNI